MGTSNTTNYFIDGQDAITMAFQIINVIGEGDYLESYDYDIGKKMANLLLKSWQNQDNHLWVKQTITLFLQNGQAKYNISSSSADHVTADTVIQTTVAANYSSGISTITISDTSQMHTNDYIGIQMDNNYLFWAQIQNIPISGTVILTAPLTTSISTGAYVYSYTNPCGTPFQVYAATRRIVPSNVDTPLNLISYREYLDMPTKQATGPAVSWAYDRQLDNYLVFLWPVYQNVDMYARMIISRKIQDINVNSDQFDLPQEWQEAFVWNLATRLAPVYGKASGDNFMEIKMQAADLLQKAMNIDNELGSIFIQPATNGYRKP